MLASRAALRRLRPGERLVSKDGIVDRVWITVEGLLYAHVHTPEGKTVTLELFTPGNMFGCLCLLSGGRYTFDATALVPSAALGLPSRLLLDLAGRNQSLCERLLANAAARARRLAALRVISSERSAAKIRGVLLWLYELLGPRMPLTLGMIGAVAGLSRESVSRLMAPMKRRGWLSIDRGLISLAHPEKLRAAGGAAP